MGTTTDKAQAFPKKVVIWDRLADKKVTIRV